MGFVRSSEEIAKIQIGPGESYDAEVLTVFFVTKPEVIGRLLSRL